MAAQQLLLKSPLRASPAKERDVTLTMPEFTLKKRNLTHQFLQKLMLQLNVSSLGVFEVISQYLPGQDLCLNFESFIHLITIF